ncbi:MAG: EF-P lysine aminoacylase EpmA [Gammaproteobacteria bacterium]|nr:EF-P lysine aminoacylase EpmA [Gammaproteobacteria bacterium]
MPFEWRPTASLSRLQQRAQMLTQIRAFFAQRQVLEVETPILSNAAGSDPHIECLQTALADGRRCYLNSSPEFAMKRLLAADVGDIYQVSRVFRQGEQGRYHNPEFTLLEWYRLDFDHFALMDEVEALLQQLLPEFPPALKLSYQQAFERFLNLNPLTAAVAELHQVIEGLPVSAPHFPEDESRDSLLDWLMSQGVAPCFPLDRPTFIYHYPASQASLARLSIDDPSIAERFECYWGELELANGFHELLDAAEQQARFEAELQQRQVQGLAQPPLDYNLIAALQAGMPACAGVALGLDRLLMVLSGAEHIRDVLAFSIERA